MKDYIKKQSEIRDQFERELDFISAHWVKEDDRPPFTFGGWRDECLDKFIEIVDTKIDQALAEDRERVVAMINDQKYTRGDYIPDDGGYMDAYDKALDDLLSSLDKPLTDKE